MEERERCERGDTPASGAPSTPSTPCGTAKEWDKNVTRSNLQIFFNDIEEGSFRRFRGLTPDGLDSDHPDRDTTNLASEAGAIRSLGDTGPSWIASIVNAVGESTYWKSSSAIIVLWDDWGGY